MHVELVLLEDHFLFYHVGLGEGWVLFVGVAGGGSGRVGAADVVALELEVRVGRPGVRSTVRVGVEVKAHLVLVLVLLGHLLEGLRGRTEFGFVQVHVRVEHPVLLLEHGRGILRVLLQQGALGGRLDRIIT